MKITFGMNGACGRMGQQIIHLASEDPDLVLGAAIEPAGHPDAGKDIGEVAGIAKAGVLIRPTVPLEPRLDVVIDFSTPEGTQAILPVCVHRGIPLLIATTGHSVEQKAEIEAAAHHTAVLLSPNTSVAVNVLMKLVSTAATLLRERGFDTEIIERHHRFKKDSPSGTALHLARLVQDAMGPMELRHGRHGMTGERSPREIGVHAIRLGDNVGEHTVVFSTLGETLEIAHRAHARDCYARGALQAAKFLADRPARRYTMDDVLGL
jgi:4-hydroxy-tetrahydrodipicolinate reductase